MRSKEAVETLLAKGYGAKRLDQGIPECQVELSLKSSKP